MVKYLEAGKIVNTHGVAGYVKIEAWCDSPEVLCSLKTLYFKKGSEYQPRNVVRAVKHKGMALVLFDGASNFDDAAALKNKIVYCDRGDIPMPEGGHFIADLIGLKVIDVNTGHEYGILKDVLQNGPHDQYEIDRGNGNMAYVPVVDEFVKNIDLEKGIFIAPIEGMFE